MKQRKRNHLMTFFFPLTTEWLQWCGVLFAIFKGPGKCKQPKYPLTEEQNVVCRYIVYHLNSKNKEGPVHANYIQVET